MVIHILMAGYVGMALSTGLSMNELFIFAINNLCMLANFIVAVERLNQYMHITSEAPEVMEENRSSPDWPNIGKVDIYDLQVNNTSIVVYHINYFPQC